MIEAAIQLIWEGSYHAVGVSEICKRADVRPGSFYYFFPSKRDLALAAIDSHWRQAKEEILEPAFNPDIAPLERIRILFDSVYEFQAQRQREGERVVGCVLGSFVGELSAEEDVIRERIDATFAGIGAYFEQSLSDAVALGLVQLQEAEIPAAATALVALYQGALLLARARNDAEVLRSLYPHALALIRAT